MTQQRPITIQAGTPAFRMLKRVIELAEAADSSISLTEGNGGVQLKSAQHMWSSALASRRPSHKSQPCGDPACPCD